MEKMIHIKDLLGEDIRSRSNASSVRREVENGDVTTLDMSGVVFVSRSFADELLSISEEMSVDITNAQDAVKTMLDVVDRSRKEHKVVQCPLGDVTRLNDMKSVDEFFSAMQ